MQGGLEEVGAILKFELRRLRWIDSSEFNRHLCALLLSRNATDAACIFGGRAKFHLSRSIPVFRDSPLGTTDERRWARIIGDLVVA
jgi:hypothetical protein